MMEPLRVAVLGGMGRMGKAVALAAKDSLGIAISAQLTRDDPVDQFIRDCDVAIDFSHADATKPNCAACLTNQKPLVIGTTGHSREEIGFIEETAKSIPVLLASNFSVGVNTLFWLTRKAAELLGDEFDLEIIETHHRTKKDAPSGTAKRLAQILCQARGLDYDKDVVHDTPRPGGQRGANQIVIHSIRAGDVVGDHSVIFASSGERLELTHKASNRETFAVGALRAARWIIGKPAALYSMEDVLGL